MFEWQRLWVKKKHTPIVKSVVKKLALLGVIFYFYNFKTDNYNIFLKITRIDNKIKFNVKIFLSNGFQIMVIKLSITELLPTH